MRILHVIYWLAALGGGPTTGLASLARAQAARGHKVQVLPCGRVPGPTTLPAGEDGNLLVHEPPTALPHMFHDSRVMATVRRIAQGQDIVHIHGTWRYHLLAAGRAAREYGIPYIIRPAGNLGTIMRRRRLVLKVPYFKLFERPMYTHAAAIHCTSQKEVDELGYWNLPTRCFIVPQPVQPDLLKLKTSPSVLTSLCPNLRQNDRVILNLGRIALKKRLELLLEAFIRLQSEFPDLHLVLAGPHEDVGIVKRVQARAEQAGIASRVSMPGMVLGEQKAALLSRATVFALPSVEENFGIAVAEAMLFGIPCIVAEGVALGHEIEKHNAGVVTHSSTECFTLALRDILSDNQKYKKCAEAARLAAQSFLPERVCDQLQIEYEQCMTQRAI